MGKRLPSAARLETYARSAAGRIRVGSPSKPSTHPLASPNASAATGGPARTMDSGREPEERLPLSEVVSDCVRRWFQDALKEARAGDAAMQVLVGQMYHSGYGVPRNEQKARAWIEKASRYRSSVWKVSEKRPGYNASDSDSDEVKESMK